MPRVVVVGLGPGGADLVTAAATDAYVQARFPGGRLPPGFAGALHRRTGGHPLFMVHVADRFAADGNGAPATTDVATFFAEVPESLSRTLEHQLEYPVRLDGRIEIGGQSIAIDATIE